MDEQNQPTNQNQNPVPPTQSPPTPGPQPPSGNKGYGKRPLWQWVLIYVVVGAVVYFIVYLLFFRGGSNVY